MKITKPYVRIQSNITIRVTAGLQNLDVTNPDAHVADRLKISPTWPKSIVLIEAGAHTYPSEIIEWPTVQALAKDKILTIGELLDKPDAEDVERAKEQKNLIEENKDIIAPKTEYINKDEKENKSARLADIAGDEE